MIIALSGADIGLAITQAMVLTGMLQWGTRQSSEVVNMMTSVERLVTFTKLPPEDPDEGEDSVCLENRKKRTEKRVHLLSVTCIFLAVRMVEINIQTVDIPYLFSVFIEYPLFSD